MNGFDYFPVLGREFQGYVSNFTFFFLRYNNKTYKVDDIDWNKNPSSTFNKNGTDVTFKEYFEKRYDKPVQDPKQPLLVSLPKAKDRKSGMVGPILLLPEFCLISGEASFVYFSVTLAINIQLILHRLTLGVCLVELWKLPSRSNLLLENLVRG